MYPPLQRADHVRVTGKNRSGEKARPPACRKRIPSIGVSRPGSPPQTGFCAPPISWERPLRFFFVSREQVLVFCGAICGQRLTVVPHKDISWIRTCYLGLYRLKPSESCFMQGVGKHVGCVTAYIHATVQLYCYSFSFETMLACISWRFVKMTRGNEKFYSSDECVAREYVFNFI